MTGPARYRRNPVVSETEIGDDVFLVEPEDQEVFYLDVVTSALWRYIDEPRSAAEIEEIFAAAFPDTAAATIAADVAAALDDMVARGLIVSVP